MGNRRDEEMKITTLILPIMFLLACILALILMNQYSIIGGDWVTIRDWMLILIPSLFGIIFGLYYLLNRR